MPSDSKQNAPMKLYAELMAEAKFRLQSIEHVAKDKSGQIIKRDYIHLQLRLLCEVIALGCLTAHGDIPGTSSAKLRKAYHADQIANALESLHPKFYPHPVEIKQSKGMNEVSDLEIDFLTKSELLKLYRYCGEALHRGSIGKLKPFRERSKNDVSDLMDTAKKIVNLLYSHAIVTKAEDRAIFCGLSMAPGGGIRVFWTTAL